MNQFRKLCCILTLAPFASMFVPVASALAAGDDKTTTITMTDANAKLQLFLGKKDPKGGTLPPVNVPAPPDGHQFTIDPTLFGSAPLPDRLILYDCGDGTTYVAAPPGLSPDEIPCPGDKKPMPLGYIPLGGSGTISTLADGTHQLTPTSGGSGATQPGRGVSTTEAPPPKSRFFWGQVGFGLGANKFSSVNNCSSILSVIPGAACRAQDSSVGFSVEGVFGVTPYVAVAGGFNKFGDTHRTATALTFNENSLFHTRSETIMGRAILPIGPFSLYGQGGVAFWQDHLKETEGLGSGSTFSTVTTRFNVNGTSLAYGGGLQYYPCPHFGVGADLKYIHEKKGPVLNESNVEAVATFNWRF
jgi:opacity protein-like surface antigen